MILVTIGNSPRPFPRLLGAMDELASEIQEEVMIQVGRTGFRPNAANSFEFLSRKDFGKVVDKARIVVIDGGVGAFIEATRRGKPVVIFPRLKARKEVIDDQAQDFIRALESKGLAFVCRDISELRSRLVHTNLARSSTSNFADSRQSLVSRIRAELANLADGVKK